MKSLRHISHSGRRGFSLLEVLTVITVSSVVSAFALGFYESAFTGQADTGITRNGQVYFRAPTTAGYLDSVRFHRIFNEVVEESNNVMVFGGVGWNPADLDEVGTPWDMSFTPTRFLQDNNTGIGLMDARQCSNIQSTLAASSGFITFEQDDVDSHDFTVVAYSRDAADDISAIVQVRRTVHDGNVFYDAVLNNLHNPTDSISYRYFVPENQDIWEMPVGAQHYWFRWDDDWRRYEQAPTRLVFPDPQAIAIDKGIGETEAMSRYVYFQPLQM